MNPRVYIIAGPNGAGKTTFARKFLPRYANCENFINADLIAQGISPFSPDAASFRAGRLVLQEIESYARKGQDFAFETTLSGRSYLRIIRRLKQKGYEVAIFFLWLPKVEIALSRIKRRVRAGGHDIPEATVRRRFQRSLANFFSQYRRIANEWVLFDNSRRLPQKVAFQKEKMPTIIDSKLYKAMTAGYERTP